MCLPNSDFCSHTALAPLPSVPAPKLSKHRLSTEHILSGDCGVIKCGLRAQGIYSLGREKYANNWGLWDGFLRRRCLIGFWENRLGSWELRMEGMGKAVQAEALQPEAGGQS